MTVTTQTVREIALEQPGIAWEVFGVRRAGGPWGPGGEPQQRARGIDVDTDHPEELRVGDEIGRGPVPGKSDDLVLREAAAEPTIGDRIAGESLRQEIRIRQ